MLKTCPSCSYIGNDSEHTCPFCKADLATARPRRAMKLGLPILALALLVSGSLTSCSVSPDGPATFGASHGAMGSTNMADYFYSKLPGVVYTYSNVQNIYNSNGTVTTLTGAPDYVRTLGFDGFAPDGDSMYRIEVTYRVKSAYAGRGDMPLYYVPATNKTPGGYTADNGSSVPGSISMLKRPRPVSTDTILAGIVGRVRTLADDFGSASGTWQCDTLWLTCRNDNVYLWERTFTAPSVLTKVRCVFSKDFVNNPMSSSGQTNINWLYDPTPDKSVDNNFPGITWGTNTQWGVDNPDFTLNVPAGAMAHSARINVQTPGIQLKDANGNSMATLSLIHI